MAHMVFAVAETIVSLTLTASAVWSANSFAVAESDRAADLFAELEPPTAVGGLPTAGTIDCAAETGTAPEAQRTGGSLPREVTRIIRQIKTAERGIRARRRRAASQNRAGAVESRRDMTNAVNPRGFADGNDVASSSQGSTFHGVFAREVPATATATAAASPAGKRSGSERQLVECGFTSFQRSQFGVRRRWQNRGRSHSEPRRETAAGPCSPRGEAATEAVDACRVVGVVVNFVRRRSSLCQHGITRVSHTSDTYSSADTVATVSRPERLAQAVAAIVTAAVESCADGGSVEVVTSVVRRLPANHLHLQLQLPPPPPPPPQSRGYSSNGHLSPPATTPISTTATDAAGADAAGADVGRATVTSQFAVAVSSRRARPGGFATPRQSETTDTSARTESIDSINSTLGRHHEWVRGQSTNQWARGGSSLCESDCESFLMVVVSRVPPKVAQLAVSRPGTSPGFTGKPDSVSAASLAPSAVSGQRATPASLNPVLRTSPSAALPVLPALPALPAMSGGLGVRTQPRQPLMLPVGVRPRSALRNRPNDLPSRRSDSASRFTGPAPTRRDAKPLKAGLLLALGRALSGALHGSVELLKAGPEAGSRLVVPVTMVTSTRVRRLPNPSESALDHDCDNVDVIDDDVRGSAVSTDETATALDREDVTSLPIDRVVAPGRHEPRPSGQTPAEPLGQSPADQQRLSEGLLGRAASPGAKPHRLSSSHGRGPSAGFATHQPGSTHGRVTSHTALPTTARNAMHIGSADTSADLITGKQSDVTTSQRSGGIGRAGWSIAPTLLAAAAAEAYPAARPLARHQRVREAKSGERRNRRRSGRARVATRGGRREVAEPLNWLERRSHDSVGRRSRLSQEAAMLVEAGQLMDT